MPFYDDPLMDELVRSRINMRKKGQENSALRKQCAQLRATLRFKRSEVPALQSQIKQLEAALKKAEADRDAYAREIAGDVRETVRAALAERNE